MTKSLEPSYIAKSIPILTKDEFFAYIRDSIVNLPLKEMFYVDDWYIDRLITNWQTLKFESDYRKYIFGLLMLPKNLKQLDIDLMLWNVVRSLVDEMIVSLAEGFYYDEMESVIGETIYFEPFKRYKGHEIDKQKVTYFLDILDTIYGRVEEGFDTLSWIRSAVDEEYLLQEVVLVVKQHVNVILSDSDMNDIATQFMACDRELEVEIEGSNVVLHLVRDDADAEY